MSALTRLQVHVDAPLTNLAIAYKQSESKFIAPLVFPEIPVQQQSNKYYVWDQDAFLRTSAQPRAPGTSAAERRMKLSTTSYLCEVLAVKDKITVEELANADPAVNIDASKTQGVMHDLLIRRDVDFMNTYMTTGVWGTTVTGTAGVPVAGTSFRFWDDYTNSDPIADVQAAIEEVEKATGMTPNTFVTDRATHHKLRRHPLITELVKYTQAGIPTNAVIAAAFGVERYLVSGAVQATSAEGATFVGNYLVSKKALLCYSPPAAGLQVPAAGITFSWSGLMGGLGNLGVVMDRYPDDDKLTEWIRGHIAYDMKVTGAPLGYFFDATIS